MKNLFVFSLLFIYTNCNEENREPKFFFGPKRETVVSYRQISEFVTEFIPSSCFVIEETLQPCRHVRNLEIYPSVPTRITKTQIPQINRDQAPDNRKPVTQPSETFSKLPTPPLKTTPPKIKTHHSPYWNWNLFNPFYTRNVTYTETKTKYVTTKVEDPQTVVSFHIKGCRPSLLPFNLPECPRPEQTVKEQEKSIVIMAPFQ
ncbi:hypothetical protein Phum_PHUM561020 [Pediculus humanus corporis]|uniref:Uncharacterized protein n=1 Tax=Pediculus humanus subsp. corporis TaxID=121224 RepID=E0W0N0_PEDHC|nr:uncharacterized protein Phum_PHUM561020 [Pediculus humanus corporis]EEB19186.1 hypothetical protein Phum_PHUM561020 [Pediculus humanus corporis]